MLELFPIEGRPFRLRDRAQQSQPKDIKMWLPVRGPRLGLLKPNQQDQEVAETVVCPLRRRRIDIFC